MVNYDEPVAVTPGRPEALVLFEMLAEFSRGSQCSSAR
jgi:hypothetical protein